MKYYFADSDSEMCYPIDHFREQMSENGLLEMQIYPAKIMYNSGFYFCTELDVSGESNDGECGKWCEFYAPRNGKNGRCKHHSSIYEASEKSITIEL